MPLVTILGLVYFRDSLTVVVLGRTWICDQRGVYDVATLNQQTIVRKRSIDCDQYLQAELMFFEELSIPKKGPLIGQVLQAHIKPCEFAKHRRVVQFFFQHEG